MRERMHLALEVLDSVWGHGSILSKQLDNTTEESLEYLRAVVAAKADMYPIW